jgi:cell division protein FtsN
MTKPAPHKNSRSEKNSIFTGVLIGLIVGAILAAGVALWIFGGTPFKLTPASPPSPPTQTALPNTPDTAPSFDFYKVLPSDTPTELPTADTPAAPVTRYYLQAGAFQNPADADNLKAQLALLGIEAVIQTVETEDKDVFHRVRVGPLHAMDEINRTRSRLSQNNIPATLVKEVPAP